VCSYKSRFIAEAGIRDQGSGKTGIRDQGSVKAKSFDTDLTDYMDLHGFFVFVGDALLGVP